MPNVGQTLGPTTFGAVDYVNTGILTIASANIISPQDDIMRVTGNAVIKTINLPAPYFQGPLFLFNTDASVGTWDATGNIALAGTMTRYHLFVFVYDNAVSKWYPNAVA